MLSSSTRRMPMPHPWHRYHSGGSVPGVHAMLTGQDWSADGLGTLDPEFIPEDMGEIRKTFVSLT
jgi:hypothetical protein